MVRAICGLMGLNNIMEDKEIRELSQNTSIESLSQTLEERLPGSVNQLMKIVGTQFQGISGKGF